MTTRLRIILLSLALAALGLASVAGAAEPVVVGVEMPVTGQVAAYGQMDWDGIQLAHQMRPTVLGRPVKLVLVDNKSDNVEAANATRRLIEKEKAVAILGPATSSKALAAAPICEENAVPMISPSATNPILTQNKNYVFRVCFIDSFQGQMAAKFAYTEMGVRKVGLLIDVSQDYSVGLGSFFMKAFKKLGGSIVGVSKCNTGDQDFSAQLTTLGGAGAELIYLPNYYTEDALTVSQARDLGIKIRFLSGDGAHAPELLKIGGDKVEGFHFTALFNPVSPANDVARDFFARYAQAQKDGKLKEDMTAFHVLGAESYLLLVDAIERAGSTDGGAIAKAIAATKGLTTVTGSFTMGPGGNPIKPVTVLKVEGGKFVHVKDMLP